jgi:uncharacterized phage-associated protein
MWNIINSRTCFHRTTHSIESQKMSPISVSFYDRGMEAAGYLLQKGGGSMKYIRLVKLLYFSDRLSVGEYEYPITYDNFSALPMGPVVSTTLNLITNHNKPDYKKIDSTHWDTVFETRGDFIGIKEKYPKLRKLSPVDVEILDQIHDENKYLTNWQVVVKSETLPEWHDPDGSSFPITIKNLLIAMGHNEEDAERIQSQIMESSKLDSIFR